MKRQPSQPLHTVRIQNIRLSTASQKALQNVEDSLHENISNMIECSDWFIESDTYEFIDLKTKLEKAIREILHLSKDILIDVDCFNTEITSFEKGIYPKYHE